MEKIEMLFSYWQSLPPRYWENPTNLFNLHLNSRTLPGIQWYREGNDLFYTVEVIGTNVSVVVYSNVTIYKYGTRIRIERRERGLLFPWTESGEFNQGLPQQAQNSVHT